MRTFPHVCFRINDRTRYALACCECDGVVTVLSAESGVFDTRRLDADTFHRNYDVASDVVFVGKVAPTVAHYLDVVLKSTLSKTDAALQSLMELTQMSNTKIIDKSGKIVSTTSPGAVILPSEMPRTNMVHLIETTLSERARAVLVSDALKLLKPLVRVKDGDARVAKALDVVFAGVAAMPTPKDVQKAAAATAATRPTTTKVPGTARKPSAKLAIHTLLSTGNKATLAQLVKETGATEVSVRTALSDLKNPKYGINGRALNIMRDENGAYYVVKKSK